MAETLWSQPQQLQQLLIRAAELASSSGRSVMESAGMSWQTLSAWKAGSRTPRPDSIKAVGQVLLLRADKLARVGQELVEAAEAEERLRDQGGTDGSDPLPLFQDDKTK